MFSWLKGKLNIIVSIFLDLFQINMIVTLQLFFNKDLNPSWQYLQVLRFYSYCAQRDNIYILYLWFKHILVRYRLHSKWLGTALSATLPSPSFVYLLCLQFFLFSARAVTNMNRSQITEAMKQRQNP